MMLMCPLVRRSLVPDQAVLFFYHSGDEDLFAAFRNNAHLLPSTAAKPSDDDLTEPVPSVTVPV